MYKLYTENMPYPDLSITLVKSVKSFRCTWVVAATLVALPEYYHNRFRLSIGHLHDGVILLLRPESFSFFLSYSNLVIPARFQWRKPKFAQESKPLKDSGRSSKMTSSCKWPIGLSIKHHTKRLLKNSVFPRVFIVATPKITGKQEKS